jgi:hypothetical protein
MNIRNLNSQYKLFETELFTSTIAIPFTLSIFEIIISKSLSILEEEFIDQMEQVALVDIPWFQSTIVPLILAKCSHFSAGQQQSLALYFKVRIID